MKGVIRDSPESKFPFHFLFDFGLCWALDLGLGLGLSTVHQQRQTNCIARSFWILTCQLFVVLIPKWMPHPQSKSGFLGF